MPDRMPSDRPAAAARQRGTTLLEALVAFLLLSFGMLSVARLQTHARLEADIARERAEAVRLGQEDMERLRAFSVVAAASGRRAYADIVSASSTVESGSGSPGSPRYLLTRRIDDAAAGAGAKAATVGVGWSDRRGTAQQVVLDSIVAGVDPQLSGALGLGGGGASANGAFRRSARIPLAAVDVGQGRSAWKPTPTGSEAWLFDAATGAVGGRCDVPAAVTNGTLRESDLTGCRHEAGLLLSGLIRFAAPAAAAFRARTDTVSPALDVALTRVGNRVGDGDGAAPRCVSEPVVEAGERHLAYRCVVPTPPGATWSGRVVLQPGDGWRIGLGAADGKVCRYSADLDASGAVDANPEHPATYLDVDAALLHQNYLVVRGTDSCPTPPPFHVAGTDRDVFADAGTVQHQP